MCGEHEHISLNISREQSLFLMCIAICAMLCHHAFCFPPDGYGTDFGVVAHTIGEVGKVCVALFLFVSGYGLYSQFNKLVLNITSPPLPITNIANQCWRERIIRWKLLVSVTIKFELRRFKRFYLNYWAVFIVFVPIGIFVFNRPLSEFYGDNVNLIKALLIDLLGVRGFGSYNITWWFNKVIIGFYLMFPLLYFGVRKCGWLVLLASMVWMKYNPFSALWYWHDWLFPFVLGMCAVQFNDLLERFFNKIGFCWSIAFAVLFTMFWILCRKYGFIPYFQSIRCDGFISLGLYFMIALMPVPNWMDLIMSFIGRHSSNVYMTHTFIYSRWLPWLIYAPYYAAIVFIWLLIVCLGISWLLEFVKTKLGAYKL